METVLLVIRLAIAALFLVAGLAKLADAAGTRQAIVEFGLPDVFARPAAVLLPWAEVAIAVALIPVSSSGWGAGAALILLSVFTAAIAVNLVRGRTPACHCFGQIHARPIGPLTLVRNGVFAVAAAFLVSLGPGPACSLPTSARRPARAPPWRSVLSRSRPTSRSQAPPRRLPAGIRRRFRPADRGPAGRAAPHTQS